MPDNGGVYLVPAFCGPGGAALGSHMRAALITGLTRGTTAGHIARAALEGIAFQVADVLDAMTRRLRHAGAGTARGRRRCPKRSADAVPGRFARACPSCGQPSRKPPPWARPTWRAWPSDFGRVRKPSPRHHAVERRFEPRHGSGTSRNAARPLGARRWNARKDWAKP